jgi:prevent-host-death family protein
MKSVNLAEAKAHLSALVSKAEQGEETIIMRRGEAVARLVPVAAPKQKLRSRREFRNGLPQAAKPSVSLIRESRDEGY